MSGTERVKPAFAARMADELGAETARALVETLETGVPETAVRVNLRKRAPSLPQGRTPVEWLPGAGWLLDSRPPFSLDPALHQGRYYVQDASSMYVAHAVRRLLGESATPVVALDACAAPGGKTTALIDALPQGSIIVANEAVPKRAAILKENVVKWGYPGVIVTRSDCSTLGQAFAGYDLIMADLPCSGEGMMRKDDEAAAQWSPLLVEECARLQRLILDRLWPLLRPGGVMLVSTCTFNRTEDEGSVAHLLAKGDATNATALLDSPAGILRTECDGVEGLRFLPGRVRGEGLFLAALRKEGESPAAITRLPATRRPGGGKGARGTKAAEAPQWLAGSGDWALTLAGDALRAMPREGAALLRALEGAVDVVHSGLPLGTTKGRELIPSHAVAMSTAIDLAPFAQVEVSRDEALRYLRREALTLAHDAPRGLVMLTWEDTPLGFAKNLGNRANNLYPAEWRLRMGG